MVVAIPMEWFSDAGNTKRFGIFHHHHHHHQKSPPQPTLGVLAFETAKTMSRLVSLYKSLSDFEVNKLRKDVMRSQGVAYLNSEDEDFLLNLAFAERLEELDYAAIAISRLGRKCSESGLKQFDHVYTKLKLGIFDVGKLNYGSKEIVKMVDKMDKFIWATSTLYSSLESLAEMETSERKLNQWRKNLGQGQSKKANFDLFDQKISFQRKHVRHLKDVSLWNQTYNNSVGLMARIICIVYARICCLFGPYISGLPQFSSRKPHSRLRTDIPAFQANYCLVEDQPKNRRAWNSGPIQGTSPKVEATRFHSQEQNLYSMDDDIGFGGGFVIGKNDIFRFEETGKNNKVLRAAPPSTVGGAGLALRYANVIIMAEKYLNVGTSITNGERDEMYQMLPNCLKLMVRSKLGKIEKKEEAEVDELLAEGWREAVKGLMEWLAPIAHDTVKWHMERNLEKQKIDAKPTVLLLQTLHYSDKEKAEAAIVEVLVGLSFICRYEKCYSGSGCDGWDSDS